MITPVTISVVCRLRRYVDYNDMEDLIEILKDYALSSVLNAYLDLEMNVGGIAYPSEISVDFFPARRNQTYFRFVYYMGGYYEPS